MVMAVGAIGSYGSNFQDPEYIKVLKELMQMGITPSGNKNADVSKLKEAKTELIEKIRPDILVKGGDYTPEQVAGREYAGEVRIIEFEDGYSTTGVVEKIAKMVKEGKL